MNRYFLGRSIINKIWYYHLFNFQNKKNWGCEFLEKDRYENNFGIETVNFSKKL